MCGFGSPRRHVDATSVGWAALTTTWAPSLRLSFVPGSKDIGASVSGSLVSRSLVSVLLFRAPFAMGLRVSGFDRWAPPKWTLSFRAPLF